MASTQKKFKKYTKKQKIKADSVINSSSQEFAVKVLKIYDKSGSLVPFRYNKAQIEYEKVRQACLAEFGYVRIVTVKARRHGISTKVAGDFYHNTVKAERVGKKCNSLVIAQDDDSSTALFDISKTYQLNADDFAPRALTMSKHRLDTSNSTYLCLTAGKQPKEKGSGKGRGMTLQQAHISEAAHIKNADTLASSLLLTVGKVPLTEVVIESTANGEGDYFHGQYTRAKEGKTDFKPFFAPWYWDAGSVAAVPVGFKLTLEDRAYQNKHGLSLEQMAWRRLMENSFGLTPEEGRLMFKQEFPGDDEEAFSFSATESFIKPNLIARARKTKPYSCQRGPIIGSLDPSECTGNDEDAYVERQGRNIFNLEYPKFKGLPQQVAFCKKKLDRGGVLRLDLFVLDAGGGGRQIYQVLEDDGYCEDGRVRLVGYGTTADEPYIFTNRKAEMSYRCREALLNDVMPPSYPDSDKLQGEMTCEGSNLFESLDGILEMESKKSLKARGYRSPNGYDAVRQTYAFKNIAKHIVSSQTYEEQQEDDNGLFFERTG